MMPPASYLDFLDLMQHAALVITDSGGVQEETTFLGVPCMTYRENTERPVTVSMGTNRVVGCDPRQLTALALWRCSRTRGPGSIYPFAPPALGRADRSENCAHSQAGLGAPRGLCRGACASVTQSALSESSDLIQAIEALRTWIESRQYAGYEPFDLLNSPYLSGAWARKRLPAILAYPGGQAFRRSAASPALKIPPSRNPKALGLCLSAYCDLARAGYDVSAEAAWLKSELIGLRSPGEPEYCWGYDWDYLSLRGTRLPAFSPNCIATYFCATAMMENAARSSLTPEAMEIAESAARFWLRRLNRSLSPLTRSASATHRRTKR